MDDKIIPTPMDEIEQKCPVSHLIATIHMCAQEFVSNAINEIEEVITKCEHMRNEQSLKTKSLNDEEDFEIQEVMTQCHIAQNTLISALRSLEGITSIST